MKSLVELLAERAEATPDHIAIRFEGEPVTFGRLWDGARRAAAGLSSLGLRSGDRYSLFLANSLEFAEIWLGGMLVGAVAVPINLAYRGEFLRHQLDDSGARAVVCDADTLSAVEQVRPRCPALEHVILRADSEASARNATTTQALLAAAPMAVPTWPDPGDYATVLYTSGTTGPSKGVVLSHEYLVRLGWSFVDSARMTERDVVFVPMPMFHVSGLQGLLTPILAGSQSVIEKRFHPATAWEIVRRFGCTGMVSVGPMIAMLMSKPADPGDRELPLRFLGTAPLPCPVEEIHRRFGVEVQTMYGLTEAFPVAVARLGEKFPDGSAGRPINEDLEIRLVDDHGADVPRGEPGEILIRARTPHAMFEGYLKGGGAGPLRAERDEWFHTGDIGKLDVDGYFYFVDRKKDAIRRRGENISSMEIEAAIHLHPDVEDVAVHAVPSDLGEDDVKAVVVPVSGSALSAEALFAHFDEVLPRFARPRYLEFMEAIPRNPVGRIQKFVLRERGLTPTTIDRG
ncbi:MAG: AMP-binding protein [bacterium]|nr:AMP-binding protein [bacterium]